MSPRPYAGAGKSRRLLSYACVHVELGGNVVHLAYVMIANTSTDYGSATGHAGTGTNETAGSAQAALDIEP